MNLKTIKQTLTTWNKPSKPAHSLKNCVCLKLILALSVITTVTLLGLSSR